MSPPVMKGYTVYDEITFHCLWHRPCNSSFVLRNVRSSSIFSFPTSVVTLFVYHLSYPNIVLAALSFYLYLCPIIIAMSLIVYYFFVSWYTPSINSQFLYLFILSYNYYLHIDLFMMFRIHVISIIHLIVFPRKPTSKSFDYQNQNLF